MVTLLEIGGLLAAARYPERLLKLQENRALALTAALERHGVRPEGIGVEIKPATSASSEPPPPLLTKVMVVIVNY